MEKRIQKYKFWLPLEKKMTDAHTLKEIVDICSLGYPDTAEPLEFTGLLDKNGKEIYEGDIIKMKCKWGDWVCTIQYGNEGFASFGYIGKNENYMLVAQDISATKTEVIGNRFENADLLEYPQLVK